jgi:hypothetical protein
MILALDFLRPLLPAWCADLNAAVVSRELRDQCKCPMHLVECDSIPLLVCRGSEVRLIGFYVCGAGTSLQLPGILTPVLREQ